MLHRSPTIRQYVLITVAKSAVVALLLGVVLMVTPAFLLAMAGLVWLPVD